jgi:hypothetical protein
LTGKKAMGKGMIAAFDLIINYKDKEINEKLGANFVNEREVKFTVIDYPVDINYIEKGKNKTMEFKVGGNYNAIAKKYQMVDDDYDTYKLLNNKTDKYNILIKEPTDTPNVFICDIVKEYNVNQEIKYKKEEDIRIKLFDSDGYKPTKTK